MIVPRYYQSEAEQSVFDYFAAGHTGDPVIAMPTGTGKSLVIGNLVARIINNWPGQRIIVLTHVKELIKQNSDKLKEIWNGAPYGIYSAGLGKKELGWPITFGGIASVFKLAEKFGHIDLMFIDEAHLLSDKSDSMYGMFIAELRKINPNMKIIKLTATPYRMGMGLIADKKDICYDITGYQAFNKLIGEGFLAPLVTKKTQTKIDISKVGINSYGEFNKTALERVIDTNDTNYLACKEIVEYGYDRQCWLGFASGVKHSEHIAAMLRSFGVPTIAVHSKMGDGARDEAIIGFKTGKYRCVVNNKVLTTGFDHPPIDLIFDLNPTMSTGLHVQKYGRGTRPSPETGKVNCLGLDFAGNVPRLGPINDPVIPRPKNASGTPGTPPIKICDQCGTYNHATARVCETCGYEFPVGINITRTAGTDELLRSDMPDIQWFPVQRVVYSAFRSHAGDNYLKATYVVSGYKKPFQELLGLEKGGYAAKRARDWWKKRMGVDEAPPSVGEALKWTTNLMQPTRIQVHINKQPYPEIVSVDFSEYKNAETKPVPWNCQDCKHRENEHDAGNGKCLKLGCICLKYKRG